MQNINFISQKKGVTICTSGSNICNHKSDQDQTHIKEVIQEKQSQCS